MSEAVSDGPEVGSEVAGPSLSVVIATYNGDRHLRSTLDSLARQTVAPERVIVVDDASTDRTVSIATAHPLAPIVVVQPENRGVAVARNRGLMEVDTTHVAFLDQDDLWHAERAESIRRHLEAHPSHGLLLAEERGFAALEDRSTLQSSSHPFLPMVSSWVNDDTEAELTTGPWIADPMEPGSEFVSASRLIAGPVTVTTSYVFDRRLLLEAGGFASWIRSADDWVLLQAMSRVTKVVRVHGPGIFYRVHPTNTSLSTNWNVPLLLVNAAVRHGGNVVKDDSDTSRLQDSPFLLALLAGHLGSGSTRSLFDAFALIRFLSVDDEDRQIAMRRARRLWLAAFVRSTPLGPTARRIRSLISGRRTA